MLLERSPRVRCKHHVILDLLDVVNNVDSKRRRMVLQLLQKWWRVCLIMGRACD